MRILWLASVVLSLAAPIMSAQRAKPSAAVALVRQLYADFACEAVIDEPACDAQHEFVDQPRAVLTRYFDDRLAQLWLADRACAARTHEICNLDFSPIWDSQDPTGTSVRILATPDPNIVNVELYHGPSSKSLLRYSLARTAAGLRIHDIASGTEWSLVSLLSGKS